MLKGFFVVGAVLLVGYVLGKTNALGPQGTKVLSTLTFLVGLPSLMFSMIASRHISEVLSPTGLISVVTAAAVMILFAVIGAIGRWGVRRTTIGALATGIVNSTNLGVPLSLYILGSATLWRRSCSSSWPL
ncbi:AEC family transporter [Pseudarthrobacter sp. BIM B-2242]|uniref:AEC family transporter n=1 Tax=Pseudarthrobacter sp. BIM B-2242 TaxID=2772401 RepID=UPI001CC5E438|nr:AEC family transporter [Pseudarthrobacter sp. BIM B-2242]